MHLMEFLVVPKSSGSAQQQQQKTIMLKMSNGHGRQLKEVAISKCVKQLKQNNKVGIGL